RLFFSIADESMPFLFTKKGIFHSYSNASKLPYFIHHILNNREEFSGKTYNFVDRDPVELSKLILSIKSYLELKSPKEIYIPYSVASSGIKILSVILKGLRKFGLKAEMPPELMFLEDFYRTQTLATQRLQESSFIDPRPNETIFSSLPDLIIYYLTRWSHQNLITTYNENISKNLNIDEDFKNRPQELLDSIHGNQTHPFKDLP
ncbi:MAG: epimerase, partial [Bacteroidetes bacterium]|nr:epimerase [Bacteroidota bacterium]